jgi:hypothetical protein
MGRLARGIVLVLTVLALVPAAASLVDRYATTTASAAQATLMLAREPSVAARGIVLSVSCQRATGESCAVEALLTARQIVGKTIFTLEASRSTSVLVPLDLTAARKLLGRSHKLPVTVAVVLTNGAGGAPNVVAARTLTIYTLHTGRIARAIERAALRQRHLRIRVSCPAVVIQKKGNNFKCMARYSSGKGKHRRILEAPFEITQRDGGGDVTFVGE